MVRAQMKIQQMAFMLIATLIFFTLIGMLILVYSFSGLKESATLLEEKNALLLASKIANSPEFTCGNAYGSGSVNCIDMDKVMIVKENIEDYYGFWNVKTIEIRKTYPVEEEVICESSTYPNCNLLRLTEGEFEGTAVSNFVSICRKSSEGGIPHDVCEMGKIIISYESK